MNLQELTKEELKLATSLERMYNSVRHFFRDDQHRDSDKEGYFAIPIDYRLVKDLIKLRKSFPNHQYFLDIGCGLGSALLIAKSLDFFVSGIELREDYENRLNRMFTNITIGNAFEVLETYKIKAGTIIYMYCPIPNQDKLRKLTTLAFKKAPSGTIFILYGMSPHKDMKRIEHASGWGEIHQKL